MLWYESRILEKKQAPADATIWPQRPGWNIFSTVAAVFIGVKNKREENFAKVWRSNRRLSCCSCCCYHLRRETGRPPSTRPLRFSYHFTWAGPSRLNLMPCTASWLPRKVTHHGLFLHIIRSLRGRSAASPPVLTYDSVPALLKRLCVKYFSLAVCDKQEKK